MINAGDGSHEHPTQALLDYFTIRKEFGKMEGLEICFAGDLLYGRPVPSLSRVMAESGAHISLCPVGNLHLPKKLESELSEKSRIKTYHSLEEAAKADVLYMTRVQEERFTDKNEASELMKSYILRPEFLVGKKTRVMHPLPRRQEIPLELDETTNNMYFPQASNAVVSRQAVLYSIFSKTHKPAPKFEYRFPSCGNNNCIISIERPNNRDNSPCQYCEGFF